MENKWPNIHTKIHFVIMGLLAILFFVPAFANTNYIGIPTASSSDNGMFTLMHSAFLATGSCRLICRTERTTNRSGFPYTAVAFFGD